MSIGVGCTASSKSALVCERDQLTLTCSSTVDAQEWTVFYGEEYTPDGRVTILPPNTVQPPELTVNQVQLRFSITSTSPLVSTVVIDNVTANADGIRLECMSMSHTINVVTNGKML